MSDRLARAPTTLSQDLRWAWHTRFVNRPRPYALQQADGTYRWVYQALAQEVMLAHLHGERTLALSCTDGEGWCRWLCLDVDTPDGLAQLMALRAALVDLGLPGLVEASRRGGHCWLFLEVPLPAADARAGLLAALQAIAAGGAVALPSPLELYPSAANTAPGTLGQAVRLPLGVHQLTGQRYPLLDAEGLPCVFTTLARVVRFVVEQPAIPVTVLAAWTARARPAHVHGRVPMAAGPSGAPAGATAVGRVGTSSPVIRWVDAHVSLLDLLDELAPECELQRAGRGYLGWCPFHDDRAPDELGRPGTPSFYGVHDRRYGWSWRCLSSNCLHAFGPLRHPFRLFQELLGLSCAGAIVAACARWPAADALVPESPEPLGGAPEEHEGERSGR